MTTIVVLTLPTAAREIGGSAVASEKRSRVPANKTAESSAQPAPAVARVRRLSPRALSGARSTDAISPPSTASGRPTQAIGGSDSPNKIAMRAAKPPASEPRGVTTERSRWRGP